MPDEVAETTRDELQQVYETAYAAYERLVELGVARELARAALPVGAYTEFYWTVNAWALMNFLSLRNSETAQRGDPAATPRPASVPGRADADHVRGVRGLRSPLPLAN